MHEWPPPPPHTRRTSEKTKIKWTKYDPKCFKARQTRQFGAIFLFIFLPRMWGLGSQRCFPMSEDLLESCFLWILEERLRLSDLLEWICRGVSTVLQEPYLNSTLGFAYHRRWNENINEICFLERVSRGMKRDKLNGTNGAEFPVFADFCWFLIYLGMINCSISEAQLFAENHRKPQSFAEFCRNLFVPFSLSRLLPP